MSISRRGFLHGILAAGIAPAIITSENAMKIWVPKKREIFVGLDMAAGRDETIIVSDYEFESDWLNRTRKQIMQDFGLSYESTLGSMSAEFSTAAIANNILLGLSLREESLVKDLEAVRSM